MSANETAREIVDAYTRAWGSGDFGAARQRLHDDLAFRGPIDTFHNADDYLAAIKNLSRMVTGMDHEGTVANGDDVVVFYVLHTPMANAPVAEWYRVRGDRIASIRTYFDARPFAPPAGAP